MCQFHHLVFWFDYYPILICFTFDSFVYFLGLIPRFKNEIEHFEKCLEIYLSTMCRKQSHFVWRLRIPVIHQCQFSAVIPPKPYLSIFSLNMSHPSLSPFISAANRNSSYPTPRVTDSTRPRPCPWRPCRCTPPCWSTTSLALWSPPRAAAASRGRPPGPDSPTARGKRATRGSAARGSWWSSLTEMEWEHGERGRGIGCEAERCRTSVRIGSLGMLLQDGHLSDRASDSKLHLRSQIFSQIVFLRISHLVSRWNNCGL